jgi:hypothetical protein
VSSDTNVASSGSTLFHSRCEFQSDDNSTICNVSAPNTVKSTTMPSFDVEGGHVDEEIAGLSVDSPKNPTGTQTPQRETTRPKCITCTGVLRPQYRPTTCAYENCTALVHQQLQCSGLNREEQCNSAEWKCAEHSGKGPTPGSLKLTPASVNGPCIACNATFRANLSLLICKSCSKGIIINNKIWLFDYSIKWLNNLNLTIMHSCK